MAYSNYRSDWNRERDERWRSRERDRDRDQQYMQRDEDDSRQGRESMERDYYGAQGRGGYGGGFEEQGSRYGQDYSQRGYGQGDYDQDFGQGGRQGQGGRFGERGEGRRHYGSEAGGWEGREREQWRGYQGGQGGYGGQGRWGQGGYGQSYSQGGYGQRGYGQSFGPGSYGQGYGQGGFGEGSYSSYGQGLSGSGRPSGGHAYGNYGGGMGYGEEYGSRYGSQGSQGPVQQQWGQEQESGQHRGRGPRGYRRSDDRIKEEVCDCLTDDDRLDATNIEVTVKDGEVQLAGTVTNREDKRWAESLAERISGVKEVQNGIRVQDQQRSQAATAASGTTASKGKDIAH